MEIDTGASVTLVSEATFDTLKTSTTIPPLEPASIKLRTYTGEEIRTLGTIPVTVEKDGQKVTLPLLVVAGTGPNLIGRNWLAELRLDWREINAISECHSLTPILDRNEAVFQPGLGLVKDVQAKLYVDTNARPLFFKARSVPYALRQKVEQELERLQNQDVIMPVPHSEWATPIVPVVKRDGSVRICGDYKLTANKVSKIETYPLPRIDDLFAALSGGMCFQSWISHMLTCKSSFPVSHRST